MDIDFLINEIEKFNGNKKPDSIRLIVGKSSLSSDMQKIDFKKNNIDIYEVFGHCAFVVNVWQNYVNDSECCVWSLLLGCTIEESKIFLNYIKDKKCQNQLIRWLYYKHGIVMVNRKGYSNNFKIFVNFKVSHVLIISSYSHKNVLKSINQCTKVAIVHHPSRNNWGVFKEVTWYNHSDKYIIEAKYNDFVFEKASLKDFKLII